ncbi:MAG TPA: heme biosynthesis protein HemY [Thioalkalivibrio sp.]|nr:heme biosynthesis protein HemY [Thioalkalivibrio sp.]
MKALFIALLLALATAVFTHAFLTEQGFVLFAYGNRSVEMPMQYFLPLTVAGLVALYVLVRFLVSLWQLPGQLREMNRRRLADRDRKGLVRGLIEMAEGRFAKAERLLIRSARRSDTPLLNYLSAARAAQLQGAYDRRDDYLRWAIESDARADVAVSLTQAELQLAHDQLEPALATLNHLKHVAPRHGYALRLLARLYLKLEDWQGLMELLPTLRRRKLFEEQELERFETVAVEAELLAAAHDGNRATLVNIWKQLPRDSRQRPDLIAHYARALIELEDHEAAGNVLKSTLAKGWDDELVRLYGRVQFDRPDRTLREAEGWVQRHGEDATLLLTLGRLALQAQLWGKARAYLDASLAIGPQAETYYELARLSATLKEPEHADAYYRAGLELAVTGHTEPPRLTAPRREALPRPREEGEEQDLPDIHPV